MMTNSVVCAVTTISQAARSVEDHWLIQKKTALTVPNQRCVEIANKTM